MFLSRDFKSFKIINVSWRFVFVFLRSRFYSLILRCRRLILRLRVYLGIWWMFSVELRNLVRSISFFR